MIYGISKVAKYIQTDSDRIINKTISFLSEKAFVKAPPFNGASDSLNLIYGIVNGAVNVFPY